MQLSGQISKRKKFPNELQLLFLIKHIPLNMKFKDHKNKTKNVGTTGSLVITEVIRTISKIHSRISQRLSFTVAFLGI